MTPTPNTTDRLRELAEAATLPDDLQRIKDAIVSAHGFHPTTIGTDGSIRSTQQDGFYTTTTDHGSFFDLLTEIASLRERVAELEGALTEVFVAANASSRSPHIRDNAQSNFESIATMAKSARATLKGGEDATS